MIIVGTFISSSENERDPIFLMLQRASLPSLNPFIVQKTIANPRTVEIFFLHHFSVRVVLFMTFILNCQPFFMLKGYPLQCNDGSESNEKVWKVKYSVVLETFRKNLWKEKV
jgi:hypothetical protein